MVHFDRLHNTSKFLLRPNSITLSC